MTDFTNLFLTGLTLNLIIMSLCWFWAYKINNYGIVDAVWSLSFSFNALAFIVLSEGWIQRKLLLIALVGFWSLRLGLFLANRIYEKHPIEDVRYTELRKEYGKNAGLRMLIFFWIQGLSVSILSVPFLLISLNATTEFHPLEWLGSLVWLIGFLGEGIADHQKSAWRKSHPDKNCETGLWKYSRHPNYFFETVIWWGFFIVALGTPAGWISIFAPLIMVLLLTKVTGVPLAEKHSLKSCGDEYLDYQKRVSVFIPWTRKEKARSK